jgi:hypothetical protein
VTDQHFWSKKKKKKSALRGSSCRIRRRFPGSDYYYYYYYYYYFPSTPLGETFAQGLARKPKSAVGSPISSTKIEPSRDQMTTCPTSEKKASIKRYLNESISNGAKYVTLDSKLNVQV